MLRPLTEFGLSQAGKLREVLTLQVLAPAGNDYGEQAATWEDDPTPLRASVEPINGREYVHGQKMTGEETHAVWIRWHATLTEKKRLIWTSGNNEVMNIISITLPRGCKRWMLVLCKETKGQS